MAVVLKLQWRLLVSENMDFGAWDKVKGAAQQITYKEHEFESKFVVALKALRQLSPQRIPRMEDQSIDVGSHGYFG
jgi:hypothetical protein